jgi:hypothetical protein
MLESLGARGLGLASLIDQPGILDARGSSAKALRPPLEDGATEVFLPWDFREVPRIGRPASSRGAHGSMPIEIWPSTARCRRAGGARGLRPPSSRCAAPADRRGRCPTSPGPRLSHRRRGGDGPRARRGVARRHRHDINGGVRLLRVPLHDAECRELPRFRSSSFPIPFPAELMVRPSSLSRGRCRSIFRAIAGARPEGDSR